MIVGQPKHFHRKYKFQLEVTGFAQPLQFATCSDLKASVAKIEYYEGGMIVPYKEPGRMTFDDITCERAVTNDEGLYSWLVDTANAAQNKGHISNGYKRSGNIVQYDRDNELLRAWSVWGLWPVSFTGGSWDNNSDEFTMESVTLALDYFELKANRTRHANPQEGLSAAIQGAAEAIGGIFR